MRKLILLLILLPVLAQAGIVIPTRRHFVFKDKWYHFKKPKHFTVKAQIQNSRDVIQEVIACCVVLDQDKEGNFISTNRKLKVIPSRALLYPNKLQSFQIRFPRQKTGSILASFSVLPITSDNPGIHISAGGGFILGASFGKWNCMPSFEVFRKGKDLIVLVGNEGKYLFEGTVYLVGKGEDVKRRIWLLPGREKRFTIRDEGFFSAILDIGGLDYRLGRRLR